MNDPNVISEFLFGLFQFRFETCEIPEDIQIEENCLESRFIRHNNKADCPPGPFLCKQNKRKDVCAHIRSPIGRLGSNRSSTATSILPLLAWKLISEIKEDD